MYHDTISKGDKVLIRWTFSGIVKKEMFDIPPSDNLVNITGFDLFRITTDDKKLAELWQQFSVGSWSYPNISMNIKSKLNKHSNS
jgi:hypothetical protein